MDLHLLFPGSTLYVPGMMDASNSSCSLLIEDNRKVLVDPGGFPSMKILEEKLSMFGLSPEDITDILLTHLHLDHAFNTIFFSRATVYLHESYSSRNYTSFGPLVGKMYRTVIDSWNNVVTVSDGDTVLGSVKVLGSPYHSRDHVSYFLNSTNFGRVFICGDVCIRQINYHEMRKGMRDDDAAAFVLKYFDEADTVIFSHDLPLFKR